MWQYIHSVKYIDKFLPLHRTLCIFLLTPLLVQVYIRYLFTCDSANDLSCAQSVASVKCHLTLLSAPELYSFFWSLRYLA